MDTKLKSSRIIGSILLLCVVILAGAGTYGVYGYFWKVAEKNRANLYESHWFGEYVQGIIYSEYIKVEENRAGKKLKPSDVYLDVELTGNSTKSQNGIPMETDYEEDPEEANYSEKLYIPESSVINLDYEDYSDGYKTRRSLILSAYSLEEIITDTNNHFESIERKTYTNRNLRYQLVDDRTEKVISSYKWTFSEETKEDYGFYAKITFDSEGNIKVSDVYNVDEDKMIARLGSINVSSFFPWDFVELIKPMEDITFYCAVSKDIQMGDDIGWYDEYRSAYFIYSQSGFLFVVFAAAVLIVGIALLLSHRKLFAIGRGKLIFNMPLEILTAVGFILALLLDSMSYVIYDSYSGQLAQSLIGIGFVGQLVPVINIGLWSIMYGSAALMVLSIKPLFVKGFKRYCLENIVSIKILYWICKKIKEIFIKIINLKSDEKINRYIVRVLLLNLLVLTVLCSIWVFGIFGLIIYTIGLYVLFQKKVKKIKDDYDTILNMTDSLANGNLNIVEEGEAGLFEPIKKNLEQIQGGFKKAVEEELKSQNMKTELITNVSHDLKTPLTAIITYINLLKEEGVTKEEQTSYIETLDMKSQRLKQLIEDLFEVSKANSRNMEVNFETVEILSLIRQVELELEEKFQEVGIDLSIRSNEEKVYLELDGQKSYRILENLFGNLVKYAMPNRKAYVDVLVKDSHTQIEVKNISKEELDFDTNEITERFTRGDKSRHSEGTGLGLAIVKSLVELQGGEFSVITDGDLFKAVITFKNQKDNYL